MMVDQKIHRASTTAPVNIAIVKYWGKRDASLNLPTNSSLSVTLSQSDLRTHTTASCSESYSGEDTLLLNNAPQSLATPRSTACLRSLRALRAELESEDASLPKLSAMTLRIVSSNNFPTAAGLASSAAGFAALIRAIADLYDLKQSPEELSLIARQGSGSACRSLLGGYVAWDVGEREDGTDSKARLVAAKSHWPDMRALILVVSAKKKDVSSTTGMQTTVKTSKLFSTRARDVVPERMRRMEKAVQDRDFEAFAEETMEDSNNFHACCLDTKPPIGYLKEPSWAAIRWVEKINEGAGKTVAAYTFDAGPNAVIYYLEENAVLVESTFRGLTKDADGWDETTAAKDIEADEGGNTETLGTGISRVIRTGVGEGPVSVQEHLVDDAGNAIKV